MHMNFIIVSLLCYLVFSMAFVVFAFERGVFSRPFLKYLYAMVPYIIKEEELVQVLDTMKAWFARP